MAYTVEQSPTSYIAGSKHPIVYVVYDSTNNGEPKYKYLCDIYIDGSKTHRLKSLPNPQSVGIFDISRAVDDYLESQVTVQGVTNLGVTNNPIIYLGRTGGGLIFCENTKAIKRVEVKFGYEFAADEDSDPTVTADVSTGNYVSVFKAHHPELKWRGYNGLAPGSDPGWDVYECSGTTDQFISSVPVVSASASIIPTSVRYDQDIEAGQSHVISWLNDSTSSSQVLSPKYIHVAGYESDGTEIFNDYFTNTALYGGFDPDSTSDDMERIIYMGSGLANLQIQTANMTIRTGMNDADLAYYEIVASDSTTLGGNQASAVYRFNIKDECRYTTRRLMFQNSKGGWDFFNFRGVSEERVKFERKGFTRLAGNFATASDSVNWWQSPFARGRKTLKTDTTLTEVLNTDWVGEEWNDFFVELKASPEVFMMEMQGGFDLYMTPVTITNDSMIKGESENKGLNAYQVTVEYSHKLNVG